MGLLQSLLGLRGTLEGYSETAKMGVMQRLGVDDYYLKLMQAQEQARGQVQNQLAADAEQRQLRQQAGLLKPLLNKYGPDAAKQIGSLLLSNSPEARAYGAQQMMGAEVSRGTAPQGVLQVLQAGQLDNTTKAQGITQAGIMGPLQVDAARAGIANTQANTEATRWRLGQDQGAAAQPPSSGQLDRQIWEQQNGAPVPSGYRPVRRFAPGPDGGPVQFIDLMPIENTEGFRKAESELRLRESMYTNIQDFLDGLAQVGTEYRGEAAYKLSEQRRRILGDYAQLLQLGVLQPSEMTNLENILPDPTSFGNQLNPFAAENIAGVYSQLGDQYAKGLKDARDRNWFIPYKPVLPEDASGR